MTGFRKKERLDRNPFPVQPANYAFCRVLDNRDDHGDEESPAHEQDAVIR
jgi:hypothetical protein